MSFSFVGGFKAASKVKTIHGSKCTLTDWTKAYTKEGFKEHVLAQPISSDNPGKVSWTAETIQDTADITPTLAVASPTDLYSVLTHSWSDVQTAMESYKMKHSVKPMDAIKPDDEIKADADKADADKPKAGKGKKNKA